MERRSQLKVGAFVLAILVLVVGLAYIASVIQRNLAPDDSSAATEDLMALRVLGSTPTANVPVGSNFQVGVFANLAGKTIPSGTQMTVTELKVNFDKTKLQVTNIEPFDSINTLSLNKQLNNTSGFTTLDISTVGSTTFTGNVQIATITFSVLSTDYKTGAVSFDASTTLGLPNILVATDLDTPLPYPTLSSSSAATTAVSITDVMKLRLVSPATLRDFLPGEQIQVGVFADLAGKNIPSSVSMTVTELKILFDPQSLEVTNIAPADANDLSLNKVLQNNLGYVTLDISKTGTGTFSGNVQLATITFTVDPITTNRLTQIQFGTENTLGLPNILAAGSLTDRLQLSLKAASSSSASSSSISSSSISSSSASSSSSTSSRVSSVSSSSSRLSSSRTSSSQTSSVSLSSTSSGASSFSSSFSSTSVAVSTSHVTTHMSNPATSVAISTSQKPSSQAGGLVCTQEVLACPDGSSVGRNPNNGCEFNACPALPSSSSSTTSALSFSTSFSSTSSSEGGLSSSCLYDYDHSGIVDAPDFSLFAYNYKQEDINCQNDIFGGDCYIEELDYEIFKQVYLSYSCADK